MAGTFLIPLLGAVRKAFQQPKAYTPDESWDIRPIPRH